jgi:hypothetical protein
VPFGAQKTPVFLKSFTTNEPRKIILDFCVVVNIKHVLNADLAVLEEERKGDNPQDNAMSERLNVIKGRVQIK